MLQSSIFQFQLYQLSQNSTAIFQIVLNTASSVIFLKIDFYNPKQQVRNGLTALSTEFRLHRTFKVELYYKYYNLIIINSRG